MKNLLIPFCLICSFIAYGQTPEKGNVIPDYGKTFEVKNPEFVTDTTSILKVVFDVNRSFDPKEPNKLIETAARFLNMHEKAGVDPSTMKVALVIHGEAVKDVLQNPYYTQEYASAPKNPNLPLIEELVKHNVEVIICGQSAAHHKVTKSKSHPDIKFALSAMTALIQLQNDDYRLIVF